MRPVRVLIADDHDEMLSAMVGALSDDPRFTVTATAGTGEEAVNTAATSAIDAVLLDVNMPGGGAATASALAALPTPPVIVAISAHLGAASVEEMVRAGAVGYLAKGRVGDALPDLLARCAEGEVVLATPAAAVALRALVSRGPGERRFGTPADSP